MPYLARTKLFSKDTVYERLKMYAFVVNRPGVEGVVFTTTTKIMKVT